MADAIAQSRRFKLMHRVSKLVHQHVFFVVSTVLFVASATLTIAWCASMSTMGVMTMPGGWTMSMVWMRMPGQTWSGAAASFLGMWDVMMVAMMLPSLVPILWRYRLAVAEAGVTRPGRLTMLVGLGYFFVWTASGLAAFSSGAVFAASAMQWPMLSRSVPMTAAVVVLLAGALQFSTWKTYHLGCYREVPGGACAVPANAGTALRDGIRLGLHCCYSCLGLIAILLVIGVMDLRAMAVVMAAMTVERLVPAGERAAQFTGIVAIGTGLILVARAGGYG